MKIQYINGNKAQIENKYKPRTAKADQNEKAYNNFLNQNFAAQEFNTVWLAGITYIRAGGKWCYLA